MSANNAYTAHTLADIVARKNPDGSMAPVVEVLNEINEVTSDMYLMEANDKTSHLHTQRTNLPTPTIRRIGLGVAASKGNEKQVRDNIMLTEGWSEIDERLVRLSGDGAGFRRGKDMAFVEGFMQGITEYVIDGSGRDEEMYGFSGRLSSIGTYCLTASGTGSDLTSGYIVDWSPTGCFGLYPAGSAGGFDMDVKSLDTDKDSSNRLMDVYRTKFQWDLGLGLADSRGLFRIANIDTSSIATLAESSLPVLDDLLLYCIAKGKNKRAIGPLGGRYIYLNSDGFIILDRLAKDKTNVQYTPGQPFGYEGVAKYRGLMIHQVDSITSTETAVS